jgi:hypothetical protein
MLDGATCFGRTGPSSGSKCMQSKNRVFVSRMCNVFIRVRVLQVVSISQHVCNLTHKNWQTKRNSKCEVRSNFNEAIVPFRRQVAQSVERVTADWATRIRCTEGQEFFLGSGAFPRVPVVRRCPGHDAEVENECELYLIAQCANLIERTGIRLRAGQPGFDSV